jgi:hypothetical protein
MLRVWVVMQLRWELWRVPFVSLAPVLGGISPLWTIRWYVVLQRALEVFVSTMLSAILPTCLCTFARSWRVEFVDGVRRGCALSIPRKPIRGGDIVRCLSLVVSLSTSTRRFTLRWPSAWDGLPSRPPPEGGGGSGPSLGGVFTCRCTKRWPSAWDGLAPPPSSDGRGGSGPPVGGDFTRRWPSTWDGLPPPPLPRREGGGAAPRLEGS